MPTDYWIRAATRLPRRWVILGLASALLAGCGGPSAASTTTTTISLAASATANPTPDAEQTSTAVAFETANARTLAAMLTPTPATSTPVPEPASAPSPTTAPAPTAPPTTTATRSPSRPPIGDLARWPVGSVGGQYPAKTSYDAANEAYTVALVNPSEFYGYTVYAPRATSFPKVRIDVDASLAAGPGDGAYGVTCGVQGTAEQRRAGFNILVHPDTQQFSVSWHPSEGQGQAIAPNTVIPALKQGKAENHLQVACQGGKIVVVINNVTVGTYTVTQPTTGGIGLIVVAPPHPTGPVGIAATFAHLLVAPLP